MKKHNGMRPQDVLILLKMITYKTPLWRYMDLASSLALSASEISEALDRCRIAKLVDSNKRTVHLSAFQEFIIYGLKYVFPVQPEGMIRGIATAHSAPPINSQITQSHEKFVWAYAYGTERGQAIEPLYKTVPKIVTNDTELYELLVIVDTIRIGKAREVEIAIEELKKRLTDVRY
jgi:hypothetical protein